MSYSDELFDKQFGLAHAIMGCNDPTVIKELIDEFFFYAFQWYQLFAPHKVASKLLLVHLSMESHIHLVMTL